MRGLFTQLGMLFDMILVMLIVTALILGIIWTKNYFDSNQNNGFLDALSGLGSNLTGQSKNLYDSAKAYYDKHNFSGTQQKLGELYDSLVQSNDTAGAQQVKDFNNSMSK